jgi:hypothetical protein
MTLNGLVAKMTGDSHMATMCSKGATWSPERARSSQLLRDRRQNLSTGVWH